MKKILSFLMLGLLIGCGSPSIDKADASPSASAEWRTAGRNLDLAVICDGRNYFLSEAEWQALSPDDKAAVSKLGIVIDKYGQRFIWSLTDDFRGISWDDAVTRFGSRLPSREQGEAIASQAREVDKDILSYGGTSTLKDKDGYFPWYWTKEEKDPYLAWFIPTFYGSTFFGARHYANDTTRVRLVTPLPKAPAESTLKVSELRATARNLDLAVSRDGKNYFISESEWKSMPDAEKAAYTKLGIVIDNFGQRFMWSLNDDAEGINWHDAMKRFGDRLPSKDQAEALISQGKDVEYAILAFGGKSTFGDRHYVSYWTKDEHAPRAWSFGMDYAKLGTADKDYADKNDRVRIVSPVPQNP